MRNFRNYNKEEIFKTIDQISIEKNEQNQIITKFGGRVINITNVSNRYEIFDIVKYLKNKIELIEKNFTISKYQLKITNGQQYLQLISDKVEVGGVEFYKSFYILNSTDKSRRLSFNVGLYSQSSNFYMIGANNVGLTKKHLTGVTKAAEDASEGLNGESFNDQIESLRSLANTEEKAMMDKMQAEEPAAIQEYLTRKKITAKPTASGLYFIETAKGNGAKAKSGQKVTMQYTGYLLNGKKFDSSFDHDGQPFSFTLGNKEVIAGWDEGVAMMNVGSSATFVIPSSLAYGSNGQGPIPPFSPLVFEVQLMKAE